jgi:hypothetical protein
VFENRVLPIIFVPTREEYYDGGRNVYLSLYSLPSTE